MSEKDLRQASNRLLQAWLPRKTSPHTLSILLPKKGVLILSFFSPSWCLFKWWWGTPFKALQVSVLASLGWDASGVVATRKESMEMMQSSRLATPRPTGLGFLPHGTDLHNNAPDCLFTLVQLEFAASVTKRSRAAYSKLAGLVGRPLCSA